MNERSDSAIAEKMREKQMTWVKEDLIKFQNSTTERIKRKNEEKNEKSNDFISCYGSSHFSNWMWKDDYSYRSQ